MRLLTLGIVIVLSTALAGCGTAPYTSRNSPLFSGEGAEKQFASEREHLNGRRPTLGLALSGGGTKAAVFSHGVLHGLHDSGILDDVDVISSVSGGGYAAYWYFMRRMELGENYGQAFATCFPGWAYSADVGSIRQIQDAARKTPNVKWCDDDLEFPIAPPGDPYRWQAHLLRWPDLFRVGKTEPAETRQSFPGFTMFIGLLATVLEAPFKALGLQADSYVALSYQYGIERTWGLNPEPRRHVAIPGTNLVIEHSEVWSYTNEMRGDDRLTRPVRHVDPAAMQWKDLRAAYGRQRKLPLWVLTTTEGQKKNGAPNPDNVFELTPFSYGSRGRGFVHTGPDAKQLDSLAKGVRASAAFADSQGLGDPDALRWLQGAERVFPGLTWGVSFKHPDWEEPVHLSDGGGADNLGLLAAVRRGLDDVIVVDTAQDGAGIMDDLCWSRAMLKALGFVLTIGKLEKLENVCAAQFDGYVGERLAYNVSEWMNPVLEGTITRDDATQSLVTRLWWIKAAWNEKEVAESALKGRCGFDPGDVNCFLAMFWLNETQYDNRYLSFPQHGTVGLTADSRATLTIAYRELGRSLARNLVRGADGRLALRNPNVLQPAKHWVDGERPH